MKTRKNLSKYGVNIKKEILTHLLVLFSFISTQMLVIMFVRNIQVILLISILYVGYLVWSISKYATLKEKYDINKKISFIKAEQIEPSLNDQKSNQNKLEFTNNEKLLNLFKQKNTSMDIDISKYELESKKYNDLNIVYVLLFIILVFILIFSLMNKMGTDL